ncbi:hypothetical protein K0M31_001819 [Melipona bicolor]|uniref:Uncharacterized protein n=1 Tax=Melipona bicolor TaxID=60889 RepID=A0AA40GG98_9HYME|nr:hypothetical protein K0M31_001819 [Melipona bicolor]
MDTTCDIYPSLRPSRDHPGVGAPGRYIRLPRTRKGIRHESPGVILRNRQNQQASGQNPKEVLPVPSAYRVPCILYQAIPRANAPPISAPLFGSATSVTGRPEISPSYARTRTSVHTRSLDAIRTLPSAQYQCDGSRTRLRSSQPADEFTHVTIADKPLSNRRGSSRDSLQEGRLLNRRSEPSILRCSYFTEYKAKRSRLPSSLSNGESKFIYRLTCARDKMEHTASADLQQLIEERDRIEAALTRSKTFYDTRGDSEPADSLQERFDDTRPLLDRFEAIQDRISDIVEGTADEQAHEQCRVEFENVYFRLLGAIQERIWTLRASTTSSNARHGSRSRHQPLPKHLYPNFTVTAANGSAFVTDSSSL